MNDISAFPGKKCHNRYWPSCAMVYKIIVLQERKLFIKKTKIVKAQKYT